MTKLNIISLAKVLGFAAIASLALYACKDDFESPASPTGSTILSVMEGNEDLDIFVASLAKVNQAASLDNNNSGFFTVFAPTDSALVAYFQARLTKTADFNEDSVLLFISKMTPNTAIISTTTFSGILTYHIVSSELMSSALTGEGQVYSTLNGARLSISRQGATVLLNGNQTGTGAGAGAKVKTVDLVASNGVVHTINRVLVPVTNVSAAAVLGITVNYGVNPPVVAVSSTATAFDLFANAVKVTGVATTLLPNKSPLPDFTVFAPLDDSIWMYLKRIPGTSVTSEATALTFIQGLNSTTNPTLAEFTDFIEGHIVNGRLLTSDFDDQSVLTLASTNLLLGSDLTVNGFALSAKDQLSNAGILHVVKEHIE